MSRSDGSTASYYELPEGCSELQELISHRDMNAQIGEIFRACYRYGIADHSDRLRDAKKIRFYADAEIERLEKLQKAKDEEAVTEFFKDALAKTLEPATMIDDESPRAQVIQQNGEMAELIYPEVYKKSNFDGAPIWANFYLGPKDFTDGYAWCAHFEDGSIAIRPGDDHAFDLDLSEGHNWRIVEARPCQ